MNKTARLLHTTVVALHAAGIIFLMCNNFMIYDHLYFTKCNPVEENMTCILDNKYQTESCQFSLESPKPQWRFDFGYSSRAINHKSCQETLQP